MVCMSGCEGCESSIQGFMSLGGLGKKSKIV